MQEKLAFEKFKEIESLKENKDKHREWLKDYEGLYFSIGENKKDLVLWKQDKDKYVYSDKRFDEPIECLDGTYRANPNKIQRHPSRLVIEFDDVEEQKRKDNLLKIKETLKEKNWGFIESTHEGKSNYLWIEFERKITDSEAKKFLELVCPKDATIDMNFSSSNKRFPVLFAEHWKYPRKIETPIYFFEGNKIALEIKPKNQIIGEEEQGEYKTYTNTTTLNIFNKKEQAKEFIRKQPIFYDKSGLWWIWKNEELFWELTDEVDVLNLVEKNMYIDTISSKERTEIINALKQVGRTNIPKPIQPTWIQFKDLIFDIATGETFKPTPEFFVTNPIPYSIHSKRFMETPTMDRIFTEWVGEKYVKTLYQIIAYSLLPSYPMNRLFCFIGSGMNGKSKFLEMLYKFLGEHNCTSTELDTLLNSRFEITRLHKKLMCQLGETNFNEISKTSILKKLTGGDLIGFEYKNKTPFHDKNYAKILISTNNLPTTTDKTVGFYRRWLIIDFPNQFSEARDILADIPEEEYESLALKCCFILKDLLEERKFWNEGSIEERMEKYEAKSDFLQKFINDFIVTDINGYITKSDFIKKFAGWCNENHHRQMSETSLGMKMKEKGYESSLKKFDWMNNGQGGNARIWLGIIWKK